MSGPSKPDPIDHPAAKSSPHQSGSIQPSQISTASPTRVRAEASSGEPASPFQITIHGLGLALTRPLTIVILCGAAVAKAYLIFSILPRMIRDYDFQCYYVSALVLRSNLNPYTGDYRPFISSLRLTLPADFKSDFTPTLLLCLEPLTRLPMEEAFWIWIALNALALAAALYLLLSPKFSGLPARWVWTLIAFALLYAPVGIHFQCAQTVIPVLVLLVCAMRALQGRHEATAGTLIAAAGLLRAFPLLLIVYLVTARQWRTLRWTIGGLMLGGALTLFLAGPVSFDFFRALFWAPHLAAQAPTDLALGSTVSRIYWYICGTSVGSLIASLSRLTTICVELGLLAATVGVTRSLNGNDPDLRGFALWVVLTVMLSPVLWPFYFVLLLIPYAQIVTAAYAGGCSKRALLMAAGSYGFLGILRSVGSFSNLREPFHLLFDQGMLISLALAFVATYWFVLDYSRGISLDPDGRASRYANSIADFSVSMPSGSRAL